MAKKTKKEKLFVSLANQKEKDKVLLSSELGECCLSKKENSDTFRLYRTRVMARPCRIRVRACLHFSAGQDITQIWCAAVCNDESLDFCGVTCLISEEM